MTIDRSNPADWKLTPTWRGAQAAIAMIEHEPGKTAYFERLGFAVWQRFAATKE